MDKGHKFSGLKTADIETRAASYAKIRCSILADTYHDNDCSDREKV